MLREERSVSSVPRTLFEMREEIRSLGGDTEIAHSRADDILIEALRFMVERTLSEASRPLWRADVEDLIAAWRDLEKWYA